jgi:hypothetical protein
LGDSAPIREQVALDQPRISQLNTNFVIDQAPIPARQPPVFLPDWTIARAASWLVTMA